ncbi:MAG: hypothetical protein KJZ75_08095 [Hyphomonadaceae bacterium]|nr:hypothetical protein [Hyphomonadaceae bacterium]GIK48388.1 MAG: hypothetical protein BroJett013_10850 [Alphaproteobacteria bacterium]
MLKSMLTASAAAAMLSIAACSQGPNEEAGEAADTAYEQSTTGQTDLGQGPMEEAGEQADEARGEATEGATTAPPPVTTP